MPRSSLSDTMLFEQNLLALASLGSGTEAAREIDPVLDRFVLGLRPDDERKAQRFEALAACVERFDANHRILGGATQAPAGSGLPAPSQRPMEFAICQFLASGAHPSWRKAIGRLAVHPRFDGALQRPLLFTTVVVFDGPGLGAHHLHTPAFAHNFLLQEASGMEPATRSATEDLARALELRMTPEARDMARQEKFFLQSFGELVSSKSDRIRARVLACQPICIRRD